MTTGVLRSFHEYGSGVNVAVYSDINITPYCIPCHIVLTRTSGSPCTITLYLNGVSVASQSVTPPSGGDSGTLKLFRTTTPIIISSFKIISSALTPDQVKSEYNKTLGGRAPFWPLLT